MYMFGSLNFLSEKEREKLLDQAKKYSENEYDLFVVELGWEDWMEEFTEAEDGECCSERECEIIEEILKQAWKQTHTLER